MLTTFSMALIGIIVLMAGVAISVVMYYRHINKQQEALLVQQRATLEKQIDKANENARAKSDFLSRMSHEIRTPLNAIIGMVQIAQNTSKPDRINEYLSKVESSSKHLLGIINDILDFSKIESDNLVLERKLFSLSQNIGFVMSMIQVKADEKDIVLSSEITKLEHDGIETDMLRLNQVLLNLLSNAIKFTDTGGSVSLEIEELTHMGSESLYRFIVQDNGVGIEPEQARKLFTPFTQANASVARIYGGTGLGLVISQRIVQMMGGDIEIETEPGKGSIFQFTIRVPAVKAAKEKKVKQSDAINLEGMHILVVDDIEINREVVAGMLEGSGVVIHQASNGKEAVHSFLSNDSGFYDLIMMDMQMPVMDGCAATREIRACDKEDAGTVKIVAMTANVLPQDVEGAFDAGMDGYLAKPIDIEILWQKIGEWL